MSLGGLVLRLRQKFGHGLRTAFYRDVVRPKILDRPPVNATDDATCEIHVLTSARDWLDLVWGLKSFYHFTGRRYRLCIHDDGTLNGEHSRRLREHFPAARLIARTEADAVVGAVLMPYPRCAEFRATNHLAPKVLDFAAYLSTERMLLLDSDVLFFGEPVELLRRIEDPGYKKNSVNRDVASAYTVDASAAFAHTGVTLTERINSGLGLIHRESLRLDWLEEFLALPGIMGHFWRIEQTLLALCSSRYGVELLPPEYDVRLRGKIRHEPARHYIGAIRHLLYCQGMRHLARTGFLRAAQA